MRVMEIVSGPVVNGAVMHCLWLCRALAERGHEVTLVCRPGSWIATQPLAENVSLIESDLHRWPADELRRIRGIARARGVDVVHTHMSRAHFFGVLLRALSRIPSVATAHSHHLQLHWMLNDGVIAVSESTARFHRRWNAVRPRRLHVIHNFIDVERFAAVPPDTGARMRVELGLAPDDALIGIIGEVIPRKGLADLLRAFVTVVSSVPAARLVVIGGGEDRFARDMRRLADTLGIGARVVWTGHRDDVAELLAAVDVVACPSRRDDLPLVALEAMAAGRPVVATTVGGFPECVVDGVTGMLVPSRDPARLAAALLALLRDADRRRRMGRAAQEHAREHFAIAPQVARIEKVLRCVRRSEQSTVGSGWEGEAPAEPLTRLNVRDRSGSPGGSPSLVSRLERGEIVTVPLPDLFSAADLELLRSHDRVGGAHKNIAYDPHSGRLTGVGAGDPAAAPLQRILRTYAERITAAVAALVPEYAAAWRVDVTSFRPLDEARRNLSARTRNDRLHIDAFPSRPTHGDRILRVFTNIHRTQPRVWLTGAPLHVHMDSLRQLPGFPRPAASGRNGNALRGPLARLLRMPALNRSPYDRFMLRLHDFMKRSDAFQTSTTPARHVFAPGATWLVFTDVVPHAVLEGKCAVEQTFIVPHATISDRSAAPLTLFDELARRPGE